MLLSIFAVWRLTTCQTLWSQNAVLSSHDNMGESLYLTDLVYAVRREKQKKE